MIYIDIIFLSMKCHQIGEFLAKVETEDRVHRGFILHLLLLIDSVDLKFAHPANYQLVPLTMEMRQASWKELDHGTAAAFTAGAAEMGGGRTVA